MNPTLVKREALHEIISKFDTPYIANWFYGETSTFVTNIVCTCVQKHVLQ